VIRMIDRVDSYYVVVLLGGGVYSGFYGGVSDVNHTLVRSTILFCFREQQNRFACFGLSVNLLKVLIDLDIGFGVFLGALIIIPIIRWCRPYCRRVMAALHGGEMVSQMVRHPQVVVNVPVPCAPPMNQ